MRSYDPSWRALLSPAAATDFFVNGRPANEAALCAELTRVAYIGFDRGEAGRRRASGILRNAGFAREQFISAGGTECFVARDIDAQLTVVAFRGTAGLRDVVTDLRHDRIHTLGEHRWQLLLRRCHRRRHLGDRICKRLR